MILKIILRKKRVYNENSQCILLLFRENVQYVYLYTKAKSGRLKSSAGYPENSLISRVKSCQSQNIIITINKTPHPKIIIY